MGNTTTDSAAGLGPLPACGVCVEGILASSGVTGLASGDWPDDVSSLGLYESVFKEQVLLS